MDALRILVQEVFLESFYEKKNELIVLASFYVSNESDVRTFLKWFIKNCPKDTLNMTKIKTWLD